MSKYLQCFQHKEYVYIGIPKNALNNYTTFFRKHHWKALSWDNASKNSNEKIYFSHIRSPHERHTKGLTEFLIRRMYPTSPKKIADILIENNKTISDTLISSVTDEHTTPISFMLDYQNIDINFILLDDPEYTSEQLTNSFFEENGLGFYQKQNSRKHVSNADKKTLQQVIRDIKENSIHYNSVFAPTILGSDLLLYERLLKKKNDK